MKTITCIVIYFLIAAFSGSSVWWYEENIKHAEDQKTIDRLTSDLDAANRTIENQTATINDFESGPAYPLHLKWKEGKVKYGQIIEEVQWVADQGQGAIDTLHWLYENGGKAMEAAQWVMGHKDQVEQAQGMANTAQNLTDLIPW